MAHLDNVNVEETSEEPRPSLSPFLGDKDIESNEDDLPLSEMGKKKKNRTKSENMASLQSDEVQLTKRKKVMVPLARTPLIRSKRKFEDEQLNKEARS